MAYIKLDTNGVVIYKTPYNEEGTIEAPDWVTCGYVQSGITYVVPAPPLASVKINQIIELTKSYQVAIQLPVAYMATTFQADTGSQDVLTKCLVAGSVPVGFYWLDANNIQVPMTFLQLQGLAGAMLVQGQIAFNQLQVRKNFIKVALTIPDVQAVVW